VSSLKGGRTVKADSCGVMGHSMRETSWMECSMGMEFTTSKTRRRHIVDSSREGSWKEKEK
jgi:hypothetical protein